MKTPFVIKPATQSEPHTNTSFCQLDLDSDVLEPFDISEGTVESKFEAPHYILDLLDMLENIQNEAEERQKFELAIVSS